MNLFADTKTIRAAIFDVIDAGSPSPNGARVSWLFFIDESEHETRRRAEFADTVIARILELHSIPGETIQLENLCPRHRAEALPKPTAQVCVQCSAEQKAKGQGA